MVEILQNYFLKVYSLVTSRTAKHTGIVFIGSFLSAIVSFFSIAIISRVLGPQNFGTFSTATAVMTTIAGFTDLGLGVGLVRFVSLYTDKNPRRAKILLNTTFKVELFIGILILLVGFLFSNYLAALISPTNSKELVFPLRLAILGGFGVSMSAFVTASFQAYQQFFRLGVFPLTMNSVRFAFLLILFLFNGLSVINGLWIYALIPTFGFFIGLFFIKRDFLFNKGNFEEQKETFGELFNFSKWIMLSFFATAIIGRVDIFTISRYRGSLEVGIYAAAFQLSTAFPIIISALTSVLLPKVSKYSTKIEYISFIKKILFGSFFVVIFILPILFFTKEIIFTIFGSKYLASIPVFRVLVISFMISVVVNPLGTVMYSLNKVWVFTIINYIQLLIALGLNFLLVPKFGAIGSAYTLLIYTIAGSIITGSYLYLALRRFNEKI